MDKPPFAGGNKPASTGDESAHGKLQEWVSVIYLAPIWYSCRKIAKLDWIEWPPSIAIKLAVLLLAIAYSISVENKWKFDFALRMKIVISEAINAKTVNWINLEKY